MRGGLRIAGAVIVAMLAAGAGIWCALGREEPTPSRLQLATIRRNALERLVSEEIPEYRNKSRQTMKVVRDEWRKAKDEVTRGVLAIEMEGMFAKQDALDALEAECGQLVIRLGSIIRRTDFSLNDDDEDIARAGFIIENTFPGSLGTTPAASEHGRERALRYLQEEHVEKTTANNVNAADKPSRGIATQPGKNKAVARRMPSTPQPVKTAEIAVAWWDRELQCKRWTPFSFILKDGIGGQKEHDKTLAVLNDNFSGLMTLEPHQRIMATIRAFSKAILHSHWVGDTDQARFWAILAEHFLVCFQNEWYDAIALYEVMSGFEKTVTALRTGISQAEAGVLFVKSLNDSEHPDTRQLMAQYTPNNVDAKYVLIEDLFLEYREEKNP